MGAALASLLPARAASWLSIVSILLATVFASNYVRGWRESSPVASPAGTLQVARDQAPDVQRLMQQVHPGDSLFVYPYMPMQYFVTQARNPTRYSYLMPGMMTRSQETEALGELEARPPEWLMYMQLSREELLRVFPNGSDRDWRFAELESWMQQNYRPVEGPSISVGGYRLWQRVPAPEAARAPIVVLVHLATMLSLHCAVVLLPILSLVAAGQAPSSSWDSVKTIAPGTEVSVAAGNSKPVRGKLEAVTDSNLVIGKSSAAHSFPKGDIRSVSVKEKGHRLRNVLAGMGVGLAVGLGIGAAISHGCSGIACGGIDVAVGGLIGLGGGIVAGVELPSGKWRQVYAQ